MQVKWQRYFSAEFEAGVFPSARKSFAQNYSTKRLKKDPVFCGSLLSVDAMNASVEDVKMEDVGLKVNEENVDASQDQTQRSVVSKLFSNAAHNYPVVLDVA